MSEEKTAFVIGEKDAVLGFSLVGVDGLATADVDAARSKVEELLRDPRIGILLVTTSIARGMRPTLERLRARGRLPLVLEIPDRLGRPQATTLRDVVRRALGVSMQ